MESLNTYIQEPSSGNAPTSMVLMFHGLGSNGQDLISLAPYMAAELPETIFIAADAHQPSDMRGEMGGDLSPANGFQWFSLQNWSPESMLAGVQAAAPVLDSFISEQADKYEIPADRIALLGFSQGTMVSLYAGPRYPHKLAGVLGFSGALVWEDDTRTEDVQQIPVHLVHGKDDPVIPVEAIIHAKQHLEGAGFTVGAEVFPGLTHGVHEGAVLSGVTFLKGVLGYE